MSETLKPCPFCGKIPEIDQTGFVWHVKGSKPLCPFGTHGVHVTAWNRRASGWKPKEYEGDELQIIKLALEIMLEECGERGTEITDLISKVKYMQLDAAPVRS